MYIPVYINSVTGSDTFEFRTWSSGNYKMKIIDEQVAYSTVYNGQNYIKLFP